MKKLGLVLPLLLLICGCGGSGGGGQQPPVSPISVSISPANQTQIDQGQTVSFTAAVANDSTNRGVTWSASGSGCMGNSCGTFTNVTTTTATYNAPTPVSNTLAVTVTATSVADTSKSKSSTVTVAAAPRITTTTLAKASPNVSYSASLQATGGVGTLSWALVAGSLPTGLQLNSAGQIYGTPTSSSTPDSTAAFTLQVTDSSQAAAGPVSAQQNLSLTVIGVLTVMTTSLPDGTVNSPYGASIETAGGTLPVVWSLIGTACGGESLGGMPPGLVLAGSSNTNSVAISGTPTTVGPSPVTFTFCATATDSSPPPQIYSQALSITIHPPGLLTITSTALPNGVVGLPYNAGLVATGGTPPYNWSVTAGSTPGWLTLSNLGVLSGPTPTEGTSTFSVTVTDSSTPTAETATQPLTLTINPAAAACTSLGNEAVLNGQYAFSLSGFNAQGFLTVVGSFTADGHGSITGGEADTNGVLGAQTGNLIATASSYHVGPDNRGCATLATPFGTFVTRFALGSLSSGIATKGRIIEWDSPNSSAYIATGQLLQQNPSLFSSGLAGSFVFRTLGWDPSATGGRTACIGVVVANRAVFSSLEQYCNDAGAVASPPAFTPAGTYSTFDGNGRGTGIASLETTPPGGGTTTSTTYLTLYMVSASEFLMVNSDPFPTVSGEMRQQNVPAGGGGFTQTSLQGNMVFYLTGSSNSGAGAAVSVETATAESSTSTLTLQAYEDRLGAWQGPPPMAVTCTYTVAANGRVTLAPSDSCGINPPIFYLTAANTGLLMDAASGVDVGSFEPQAAGTFSNSSLSGTFFTGPTEVVSQSIGSLSVGEVTMTPGSGAAGSIGGTKAVTSTTSQTEDSPITDTYTVNPDGTFTTGSSSGNVVGIVINSNKFVMLDTSSISTSFPLLLVGEQ